MSTSISAVKAGNLTRQSLSGVWLKNVFWRWRIYCVLKADNRLELHGNKRSFGNGHAPRTAIDLSTAICICPAEYISPSALLILTGSVHMCLSSVSTADRDEWISTLNGAAKSAIASNAALNDTSNAQSENLAVTPDGALTPRASSLYIRIWPVNVLPSTVTTSFQLHGRYWFAANNTEICILPYASPSGPLLNVSFSTIRCCGGVGQTRVFFELGRQANTGEGTLWLQAISASAADDMKRFLSEFLSKRDTLADGSKKPKRSDRLVANAGKVKHGVLLSNEILPPFADEVVAEHSTPVPPPDPARATEKTPAYIEMAPPKQAVQQDKKCPSLSDGHHAKSSENSAAAEAAKVSSSQKGDFLELNFSTDTAAPPQLQASDSISSNGIRQHRPSESSQRLAPQDNASVTATTPPVPVKAKPPQQQDKAQQLQIEKAASGGDYVVVCAPKGKPQVLHSKSQESASSATAASGSTDEDTAPFLAEEFQPGASLLPSSAVGEFQLDLQPANSTSPSGTSTTVVLPSSGPVQYVSLQISNATDNATKEESNKSSNSPASSPQQPAAPPQMSSVSVIYADLDFTSTPNRAQTQ